MYLLPLPGSSLLITNNNHRDTIIRLSCRYIYKYYAQCILHIIFVHDLGPEIVKSLKQFAIAFA